MRCDSMPFYPPGRPPSDCMRLKLFSASRQPCGLCVPECAPDVCTQRVRLQNPACPQECAEVELWVDECGCLMVCVHRPQSCCPPPKPLYCGCSPRPPKPACGCRNRC